MNNRFFTGAFLAGLFAIIWVSLGFVGTHLLAFAITLVIGGCYIVGALELRRFRQATTGLSDVLSGLSTLAPTLSHLGDWLVRVPASLQSAVRLRVEGERAGLPLPTLTPYLVGLLLMLGMLGTFLGMVVTLNGAAFAMEGTTDLQAMRASLTEPIKGLGLAFGTSIAGVAASAMLGLMSALSRHERLLAVQQLDQHIATDLRAFSLTYQRQETLKSLQQQALVLPAVAAQLEAMMLRVENMNQNMSQQLGEHLIGNQERFHSDTKTVYTSLAASIDQSLKESAEKNAHATIASIQPLVEKTLVGLTGVMRSELLALREQEAQRGAEAVDRLGELQTVLASHMTSLGVSLEAPIARLVETASEAPRAAAEVIGQLRQEVTNSKVRDNLLLEERAQIMETMSTLLASINHAAAEQRGVIDTLVATTATAFSAASAQFAQQVTSENATLSATAAQLEAMMARVESTNQNMSRQLGEHLIGNQERFHSDTKTAYTALTASIDQSLKESVAQNAQSTIASIQPLVENTLVGLTSVMRDELVALRDQEAKRGADAVERLAELQTVLANHMTTLGLALEAPIARLIETASEAPRAAAEVIVQLRQEVTESKVRDNLLLEERAQIMETMSTLLASINQAAAEQRAVIDTLVTSAATALSQTSEQFAEQVKGETAMLSATAAQVTSSAVDVASLGDAFGFAVKTFTEGNQALVRNLQRIETALDKVSLRNDEQLAYYVAQAREIIDLSMSAQKGVVDEIRELGRKQKRAASELA
jgi:hypothetical protein